MGGAVCCNGECNVTDSNFINNNVTSGHGGAVWSMAANVCDTEPLPLVPAI